MKPSKCKFGYTEINILGHIVNETGTHPDRNKLKAINDFLVPKKVKDVQSFVGLCNYYRKYIENCANLGPLYNTTKKKIKFV